MADPVPVQTPAQAAAVNANPTGAPAMPAAPQIAPQPVGGSPGISGATAINLDTPITANGKTYTVNELIAAHAAKDTLTTELGQLRDDLRSFTGGYDSDPTKAIASAARALTVGGMTPEVAQAEAEAMFAPLTEQPAPVPPAVPAIPVAPVVNPIALQQAELEFTERLDSAVASDPTFKQFADHISLRDNLPASGEKALAGWRVKVEAQAKQILQAKKEVNNNQFDFRWVPEAIKAATVAVADEARLYLGDPNDLGKSAVGGSTGGDPFANLMETEPVAPAKFDASKPHEIEEAITSRMGDALARAAQMAGTATAV